MSEEKHLIWSNYDLDYDDWRDDLEADYPDNASRCTEFMLVA